MRKTIALILMTAMLLTLPAFAEGGSIWSGAGSSSDSGTTSEGSSSSGGSIWSGSSSDSGASSDSGSIWSGSAGSSGGATSEGGSSSDGSIWSGSTGSTGGSQATLIGDVGFLHLIERYLNDYVAMDGHEAIEMNTTSTVEGKSDIQFNFTEGNQTIVAVNGDKAKVFFNFTDDEMMSLVFRFILVFDEIEARLESGKHLEITLRFSETEVHHITRETLDTYYGWLN